MKKTMLVFALLGLASLLWAADPFEGTWKLNLAKSTFPPGQAPKSHTIKATAQNNGLKDIFDMVRADGQIIHFEFTAQYDGKDYPVKGDPDSDAIAVKKSNPNTLEYIVKKGGKEVKSGRTVVSPDGKSFTQTHREKNQKGEVINSILVFDRQ